MRDTKYRTWDYETKFRIWDCDNETWTFVTLYDLTWGACTPDGDKPLTEGSQPFEQYTGLKDKNDKEIYEGDILALYHRDGSIVNLCQVFWNELDNEYDWKPVGEDSWSDLFSAFYDDYKVVGNVHEYTP